MHSRPRNTENSLIVKPRGVFRPAPTRGALREDRGVRRGSSSGPRAWAGSVALVLALGVAWPARAADSPPASPPHADSRESELRRWNRDAFAAYERDDLPLALSLYQKAARAGDPSAKYNLAVMRVRDETTRPSLDDALRLLRESASAGFAPAQFMLGSMLDAGQFVTRSSAEAARWFGLAAKQGHPDAALALGLQYFLGRGVAQDYALAARWYRQAAEADDVAAQYILASMYEQGLGVAADLESALLWYTAAARQGDVAARVKAKALVERMARERES